MTDEEMQALWHFNRVRNARKQVRFCEEMVSKAQRELHVAELAMKEYMDEVEAE